MGKILRLLCLVLTFWVASPARAETANDEKAWKDFSHPYYRTAKGQGELLIIRDFVGRWERYKADPPSSGPSFRPALPSGPVSPNPEPPALRTPRYNPYYESWKQNPTLARDALNRTLNEYRKQATALETGELATAPSLFNFLRTATGLIKDPVYGMASDGVLYGMETVLDETNGESAQRKLQDQYLKNLGKSGPALDFVYQQGIKDPKLRDVLNPVMSPNTHVVLGDPAEANYRRNGTTLDEQDKAADALLPGADGKTKQNLEDTKDLIRLRREALEKLKNLERGGAPLTKAEAMALQKHFLETTSRMVQGELEKQRKSEQDAAKLVRTKELRMEAWRETATAVSSLISHLDADAGRKISAFSGAALEFSQNLSKANELMDSDLTMGSLMKVSSILNFSTGVFAALSMFGGPDTNALILQEVKELRKDLHEMRNEMRAGFNQIDKRLVSIFNAVMTRFDHLDDQIGESRIDLKNALAGITELHRKLDDLSAELKSGFEEERLRDLNKTVADCIDGSVNFTSTKSPSEVEVCLNAFYRCAVYESSKAFGDGAAYTSEKAAELDLRGNRAFEEMNYLATLGAAYQLPGLMELSHFGPTTDKNVQKGPINPQRWAMCAQHYVSTAKLYPAQFLEIAQRNPDDGSFNQIERIREVGRLYPAFAKNLSDPAAHAQEGGSAREGFRNLFKQYVSSLRGTANQVHEARTHRMNGESYRLFGFDPLLGVEQPLPDHPVPFKTAKEPGSRGFLPGIAPPPEIKKLIPPPFFLGHQAEVQDVKIFPHPEMVSADKVQWVFLVGYFDKDDDPGHAKIVAAYRFEIPRADYDRYHRIAAEKGLKGYGEIQKFFWESWGLRLLFNSELTLLTSPDEEPLNRWVKGDRVRKEWVEKMFRDMNKNRFEGSAHAKAEEHLAKQHAAMMQEIGSLMDHDEGELKSTARRVEAQRSLLEGMMTVAWPQSMAGNPRLRSLFQGEHRLPSGSDLATLVRESRRGASKLQPPPTGGVLELSQDQARYPMGRAKIQEKIQQEKDPKVLEALKQDLAVAEHAASLWRYIGDYLDDKTMLEDLALTKRDILFMKASVGQATQASESQLIVLKLIALHKILFTERLAGNPKPELPTDFEAADLRLEALSNTAREWAESSAKGDAPVPQRPAAPKTHQDSK